MISYNLMFAPQGYAYVGWQETLVSGWGTLSSGGVLPSTLQWVKVPPVSTTTCNQAYNGAITSNMICAGNIYDNTRILADKVPTMTTNKSRRVEDHLGFST